MGVAADAWARYIALIQVAEVHADTAAATPQQDLATYFRNGEDMLLPAMNAKQAVVLFERCQAEAPVVVGDTAQRRVLELLTEAHTLRRYSEEMDKQRREITGRTD